MGKDTFYFSHDYNSRSDEKIKLLIRKHGILGYGVFWVIIEDLYNNANALRLDYEGIAYDLRIDVKIIESIINDFDLFVIKEGIFGSLSVERRLNQRNEKSTKARDSAKYRWDKFKNDANALQSQSEGNAIKERKGKEIKEKEITIEDVKAKFLPNKEFGIELFKNETPNAQLYNEQLYRVKNKFPVAEDHIEFNSQLKLLDKVHTEFKDYAMHFRNWLATKPEKKQQEVVEVDSNGKPRPSKQHRLWGGKWIVE
jgi:hypothetical protein